MESNGRRQLELHGGGFGGSRAYGVANLSRVAGVIFFLCNTVCSALGQYSSSGRYRVFLERGDTPGVSMVESNVRLV